MRARTMRVTSRYTDKTYNEHWHYEVDARDDAISALEVEMATQRINMWGAQGLAERLDDLTRPITL